MGEYSALVLRAQSSVGIVIPMAHALRRGSYTIDMRIWDSLVLTFILH